MRRFILHFSVMMVSFVLGVAANALVHYDLAAINAHSFDNTKSFTRPSSVTLLAEEPRFNPAINHCGLLVVRVTDDRGLYLNRQEIGSLDDTRDLVTTLEEIFRSRTEAHASRDGLDLNAAIGEDEQIEKTVFIKAPRGMSYGELSDLLDVIKATGASPIGLVTELDGYPCLATYGDETSNTKRGLFYRDDSLDACSSVRVVCSVTLGIGSGNARKSVARNSFGDADAG